MGQAKTVIGRTVYPRGAWASGTNYKKFNIVTNGGSVFMALQDDPTTEPTATYDAENNTYTVSNGWLLWVFGYSNAFAQSMNAEFTRQLGLINANKSVLDELKKIFGEYSAKDTLELSVAQSGKYVGVTGSLVSNANFAVSAPITLTAGNIYLFKSTNPVGADVSLFAKLVTGINEVGIKYTYTYDTLGNPLTATADHDAACVYTYHYSDGEDGLVLDHISDASGTTVPAIPRTREVAYSEYQPLFFSGASLPASGHYIYLAAEDENVVVSGLAADIDGTELVGAHFDIFTALAYALSDRTAKDGEEMEAIAGMLAEQNSRTSALENLIKNGLPSLKVDDLTVCHKVDDFSYEGNANLSGDGAPDFIPDKIGQKYLDKTNGVWYISIGNTDKEHWVTYQNIIEAIKVNGAALEISSKGVNIIVPTSVSDLSDSDDYVQGEGDELAALAALVVEQNARISALESKLRDGLTFLAVDNLQVRYSLDDFSTKGNANLSGDGAPTVIPDKVGQRYLDTTNNVWYTATGNTAVSQWKQDTNS